MIAREISPNDFEKDLLILTERLDANDLGVKNIGDEKEPFYKIIDLLEVDLNSLTKEDVFFLKRLIDKGEKNNVLDLFEAQLVNLDINNLQGNTVVILRNLMDEGKTDEIFELFEKQLVNLDINNLQDNTIVVLRNLMYKRKTDELFNLFETKIANLDINNLQGNTVVILGNLMYEGKTDEIFELFETKIANLDINNLQDNTIVVLRNLMYKRKTDEIFELFETKIANLDINNLQDNTIVVLRDLMYKRKTDEIFELFEKKLVNLDINNLQGNTVVILRELMYEGKTDELFNLFETKIANLDINNLQDNTIVILRNLMDKGKTDEIFELLKKQLDDLDINNLNDINGLILAFIKEGKLKKDFINLSEFKRIQLKYRDIIDSEKLTRHKGWPDVDQQIFDMPIDENSKKEHQFGWSSFKLRKSGSSTTVYIQRNKDGKVTAVLFKNKEIPEEAVNVYREVFQVIPGYVSSAIYPELNNDRAKIKVSRGRPISQNGSIIKTWGFREVYAGVSLKSINLDKIPRIIRVEILRQKEYILLMLKVNNLRHAWERSGHTHDGNFNVRFLVESDGQKQVMFDLNEVLELMKNNKDITLTPIVTLRDWDQGVRIQ